MLSRDGKESGLMFKYDKESFVQMQKQGTLTKKKVVKKKTIKREKKRKKRNQQSSKIPFWHYAINKILRTFWRVPKGTNPITDTIAEFLTPLPPLDDAVVFFNKWFTVPLKHGPGDDSVLPPPELPPPSFTVKYNDNYGSSGRGKVRKHKFLGTEVISKYVQPEYTHLFFKLMQKWDKDFRTKALSKDQESKILRKKWYVYVPLLRHTPPNHMTHPCRAFVRFPRTCPTTFQVKDARDLCNDLFLGDEVVFFFMRYLTQGFSHLHVVSFAQLLRYYDIVASDDDDVRFVRRDNRSTKLRSKVKYSLSLVPEGHLEGGGIIVSAINYPRSSSWKPTYTSFSTSSSSSYIMHFLLLLEAYIHLILPLLLLLHHALPPPPRSLHAPFRDVHWIPVVLSGDPRSGSLDVRVMNDSMMIDDPKSKIASSFFVHCMKKVSRTIRTPSSCTRTHRISVLQILEDRFPNLDRFVINRIRLVNHPNNKCALHAVAQAMLLGMKLQSTHWVTPQLTDRLRSFMVSFLIEYETKSIPDM